MAEKKSKRKLVLGGCAFLGCGSVLLILLLVVGGGAILVFQEPVEDAIGFEIPDIAFIDDLGLDELAGDAFADMEVDLEDSGDTGQVTEDPTPAPVVEDDVEDPTPEPVVEDEVEDPTPAPVEDDGDSSTGGRPDSGDTARPGSGDDDDQPKDVSFEHDSLSMLMVGEKMSIAATTPDVDDCRVKFAWRPVGSSSWTKKYLKTKGEKHTLTLTVTAEMSPEFEYYLKSYDCGTAKWPKSGYQSVKVF